MKIMEIVRPTIRSNLDSHKDYRDIRLISRPRRLSFSFRLQMMQLLLLAAAALWLTHASPDACDGSTCEPYTVSTPEWDSPNYDNGTAALAAGL